LQNISGNHAAETSSRISLILCNNCPQFYAIRTAVAYKADRIAVDGMASAMEASGSISSTAVVTEAVVIVVTTALVDIADIMAIAATTTTMSYSGTTASKVVVADVLQLLLL
jgi:hypothetical protein